MDLKSRGNEDGSEVDGREYQAVNCFLVHFEMCSV